MKPVLILAVVDVMVVAAAAFAIKTYQFTGKVLEVMDNVIAVDKNGEKFEMPRTSTQR
jgi:uncharacterized membrane protein YqhA